MLHNSFKLGRDKRRKKKRGDGGSTTTGSSTSSSEGNRWLNCHQYGTTVQKWTTDPLVEEQPQKPPSHQLTVTPLPADKHALARPRLSAPAEAREIRKARRAAGDLSSRDGDWRRAAPSKEEISEKRATGLREASLIERTRLGWDGSDRRWSLSPTLRHAVTASPVFFRERLHNRKPLALDKVQTRLWMLLTFSHETFEGKVTVFITVC